MELGLSFFVAESNMYLNNWDETWMLVDLLYF